MLGETVTMYTLSAHLSDGLAKTGNTDPLYLAIFQDCVYIRANSLDTCYKSNVSYLPTVLSCNVAPGCVLTSTIEALHHLRGLSEHEEPT